MDGVRICPAAKTRLKRKNRYKKPVSGKGSSDRRCRVCDKDPYPNYFFCPSCHRSLGAQEDVWDYPWHEALP